MTRELLLNKDSFSREDWKPRNTSPFAGFRDSIRLCDLHGADDAGTAGFLGFGRALRAAERGWRSSGEAERDHPMVGV